eukprot:scaffold1453_cov45-Attheya_sp.AAC.2
MREFGMSNNSDNQPCALYLTCGGGNGDALLADCDSISASSGSDKLKPDDDDNSVPLKIRRLRKNLSGRPPKCSFRSCPGGRKSAVGRFETERDMDRRTYPSHGSHAGANAATSAPDVLMSTVSVSQHTHNM